MIRIGITGTDTGVGKTVVGTALLALLRARGLRVSAFKPVETGVERGDPSSDAEVLRQAAGGSDPQELVCPYALPQPIAPWLAAREAGVEIRPGVLDRALAELSRERDVVLIEGAGGLLVPVAPDIRYDTLFNCWGADVIIVARDRLGVINHTLLTVEAAQRAGLRVLGVVVNRGEECETDARDVSRASNLTALTELLPELPVIQFPIVPAPRDFQALADIAVRHGLGALVPGVSRPAD
ncbi:MAG TPA: dethiobiotin synthase [Longimicrobiales bacterium]|nr:dethiobiotin synthase [Longimicrobiales bacterium]